MTDGVTSRGPGDELLVEARGAVRVVTLNRPDALNATKLTGLLRAKEYILLGDRLPAAEAHQIGLANRVVPSGTSVTVALELAERMTKLPPQALRESKALLNHSLHRAVDALLGRAVEAESASFDEPAFQANLARMLDGRS